MPRFNKKVSGASDAQLEQRLEPMFPAMDLGRRLIGERAAKLEQARLTGARRELSRLAHKYGAESVQARGAADALRVSVRQVAALELDLERLRIGHVQAEPESAVVYGRVLDAAHRPRAGLLVAIVDATGQLTSRTKTDERGAFKLEDESLVELSSEGKPTGERVALGGRQSRRRSRLVVRDGDRELHAEELDKLEAGQARYREIVLRAPR